jgi:aminoglycoside 6-adenylyltransferase
MTDLILSVANADERIRAVILCGSRANPLAPRDKYMDYDIVYLVDDVVPFFDNPAWITAQFGKPLIVQMPETMRYPEGDGNFNYLALFGDGNRIDLSFVKGTYPDDGEPCVVLLDKDGRARNIPTRDGAAWHIVEPPSALDFYSCCNEFWWCMNNAAKGIARGELPYVMHMLNDIERVELENMLSWYIGVTTDFSISVGKMCKYLKRYLPPELYARYAETFSDSDYAHIWAAIDAMCALFHDTALAVAEYCGFTYRQDEEDGLRRYLELVKNG